MNLVDLWDDALRVLALYTGWPAVVTRSHRVLVTFIADDGEEDKLACRIDWEGARFALPLPLLLNHDHNEVIGHVIAVRRVGRALRAQASLPRQFGHHVTLLREEVYSSAAGFRSLRVEHTPAGADPEHYVYREIELMEISWVATPLARARR